MNCPRCSAPTVLVAEHQQWFCQPCQAYVPAPKSGVNLWLVIGLPLALVAIAIGVFLYLTTRSFNRYMDRSKTVEVHEHLRAIHYGAKTYFAEPHAARDGLQLIEGQLPGPSAGPTPAVSCCDQGGKCAFDAAQWEQDPVWRALEFGVYRPHYYQYDYVLADDGQSFTARAVGDLDCDGVRSTFELHGVIREDALETSGELIQHRPTE